MIKFNLLNTILEEGEVKKMKNEEIFNEHSEMYYKPQNVKH